MKVVASGPAKAMLSLTVPLNRKPSCGTMPSCERSDCAVTARIRLSDVIEMRVSADGAPNWQVAMPLTDIVEANGDRLLWQLAV